VSGPPQDDPVVAADVYEVEVVPLGGWRAARNVVVELLLSTGGGVPTGTGTVKVRVTERATGRTIYEDPSTSETSAALLRERLETDLREMSPEEFVQTWG
jgi:hypothetical protein